MSEILSVRLEALAFVPTPESIIPRFCANASRIAPPGLVVPNLQLHLQLQLQLQP